MTHTKGEIRDLLAAHGLEPRRAFGQNFVIDPNTVRRIARLSGVGPGDSVIEIGPGLGSLTLALAETGAKVRAVEVDRDIVPVLREVVAGLDVDVVEADAADADWAELLEGSDTWTLVANLPYNVATPLVLDLLRRTPEITAMLVMVQREAGERLAASPGDAAVGIPSLVVAYHATARVVARVPATVFLPQPRVESVLVRLDRHDRPPVSVPFDVIDPLIRAGFGQRRKMLRRSLAGLVDPADFEPARVDPTARAETLGLDDWARLAEAAGLCRHG